MEIGEVDDMVLGGFTVGNTDELRIATQSLLSPSISFAYESHGHIHSDTAKDNLLGSEIDTLWSNEVDSMFSNSKMFCVKKSDDEDLQTGFTDKKMLHKQLEIKNGQQSFHRISEQGDTYTSIINHKANGILQRLKIKSESNSRSDCKFLYPQERSLSEDQIVPSPRKPYDNLLHSCKAENMLKDGKDNFIKYNLVKVKEKISQGTVCLQRSDIENQIITIQEKESADQNEDYDSEDDDDDIDENEIRRAAPKNCRFVNYIFDSSAILPTFQDAFVPILKMSREREEGKSSRKRKDFHLVNNVDHKRFCADREPCRPNQELTNSNIPSTDRDQTSANKSSTVRLTVLDEGNTHSEISDLSDETQSLSNFNLPNDKRSSQQQECIARTIKREIKQEFPEENEYPQINLPVQGHGGLSDKGSNTINPITQSVTPVNQPVNQSMNVDNMRNIFTFDEGLEMLELEKGLFSPTSEMSNATNQHTPKSESGILSWALGLSTSAAESHSANELVPSVIPDMTNEQRRYQSMPINSWEAGNQMSQGQQVSEISPIQSVNGFANGFVEHEQMRHANRDDINQSKANNVLNPMSYSSNQIPVNNQSNMAYVSSTSQANHLYTMDPPSIANGRAIAQQIHESFGTDIFTNRTTLTDNYSKIRRLYAAQGTEICSETTNDVDISHTLNSFLYDAFSNPSAKFSNSQTTVNQNNSMEFSDYTGLDSLGFVTDKY